MSQPIRSGRYVVRLAESGDDLAQLHRLNYQTFVHEVPQHAETGDGQLVDKFHDKNTYFVALDDGRAVGMLAVHDSPPFSIAEKLSEPDALAGLGPRPLEVRLLAIEPGHRRTRLFAALTYAVYKYAQRGRYSHLLISGFSDRIRLYRRLGFRELGPPVRDGSVMFVPMVAVLDEMPRRVTGNAARLQPRFEPDALDVEPGLITLTPGPGQLSPAVKEALAADPLSHRSRPFEQVFVGVRGTLEALTGAPAALFSGSGTLANDIVATTLSADRRFRKGAVLVNGEFGRRLARQAERAGLDFTRLECPWAKPWRLDRVEELLADNDDVDWVWAVHLESSTGMLNDVHALADIVRRHNRHLCLDCISSLGAVPVDLSRVHLGTGVANKSLGGVAGLSIVFAHEASLADVDTSRIAPYLDLVDALRTPGTRFTFPSSPLYALDAALRVYADPARRDGRFRCYDELGRYIRSQLGAAGLEPIVAEPHASPVITTFVCEGESGPDRFIERCLRWGYIVGGARSYLRERNWFQLATMGDLSIDDCRPLFDHLSLWHGDHQHPE